MGSIVLLHTYLLNTHVSIYNRKHVIFESQYLIFIRALWITITTSTIIAPTFSILSLNLSNIKYMDFKSLLALIKTYLYKFLSAHRCISFSIMLLRIIIIICMVHCTQHMQRWDKLINDMNFVMAKLSVKLRNYLNESLHKSIDRIIETDRKLWLLTSIVTTNWCWDSFCISIMKIHFHLQSKFQLNRLWFRFSQFVQFFFSFSFPQILCVFFARPKQWFLFI